MMERSKVNMNTILKDTPTPNVKYRAGFTRPFMKEPSASGHQFIKDTPPSNGNYRAGSTRQFTREPSKVNMKTILKEGPRALNRYKQFDTTETDDFVGTMTEPYKTIGKNVRVRPRSDILAAPRRASYPASRIDPRLGKSENDIYMVSVEDPYKISRIYQTMPHKTDMLSLPEKNKHAILILEPDMDSHIGRHVRSRYIYTGDIPTSTGGIATFERDLYTASEPDPLVTPSEGQFKPSTAEGRVLAIAKTLPSDASVPYGKAPYSQSAQSLSPTSDPYTASSVSPERHSGTFVPAGRDWPMLTEQAQHMSSETTHTFPTYTESVRSRGKFYMPLETGDLTASGEDSSVTYMIDPDMLIPDNDILDTSRKEINSPSSNVYMRSQINPDTFSENDKHRFSGRHHYALPKAMVSRALPHQEPNNFDRELLSDRFRPYGSARMNALPIYTGDKPIFTGDKPIFTGDKPIYKGDKPIYMGDESIFTEDNPIYMGDQPYFKVSQSPFTVPVFNRDYHDSRLLAYSEPRRLEEGRFDAARDSRITNYDKQKQHLNSKRMTLNKQPFQRMLDVTGEIGVNKRMTPFHRYYKYRYFTPTATKRRRRIVRTRYGYTLMYFDEHGPLDTLASGLIG